MKIIIFSILGYILSNTYNDSLLFLQKNDNYLRIIELADDAIKKSIKLDHSFFKSASESALKVDDFDKSIQFLKKAISLNDNKSYREEWDRIVRMRKDIEIALKKYQEQGDYLGAVNDLNNLEFSNTGLVDYSIGKLHQQEENYEKALSSFKKAVEINPYREKYKLSMNYIIGKFIADGDEYYSMRDFTSANSQYMFAYDNMINDESEVDLAKKVALQFKISKTLFFLREYPASEKMLNELLSLDQSHFEAYKLIGDVQKRLDRSDLALKNYIKAIEINESYEKAYLAVGQIYFSENNIDESLKYLEKAIDLKKDYAKAYETIGVIYQNAADGGESKEYTKSLYYYEQALNYDRRNYKVMARLSSVYNNLSKYDLAKKYAKDCIKVKRNYPDAYYELGIAEKGLGNRIAAMEAFKNAKKSSKWRKIAQYEIDLIKQELN
ncbi:tetratricopeptide repeat protein [Candidatus Marinimicrobia bacterium]|nr:tetratricopeptide repeat protein [Candidatus Neomarinimicrobiota bacterium]